MNYALTTKFVMVRIGSGMWLVSGLEFGIYCKHNQFYDNVQIQSVRKKRDLAF